MNRAEFTIAVAENNSYYRRRAQESSRRAAYWASQGNENRASISSAGARRSMYRLVNIHRNIHIHTGVYP